MQQARLNQDSGGTDCGALESAVTLLVVLLELQAQHDCLCAHDAATAGRTQAAAYSHVAGFHCHCSHKY
jgi:hypothetical protein